MRNLVLIFLWFLNLTPLYSFCLRDHLLKAEKGDYIVSFQNNIYSLLIIDERTDHSLLLAQISVPAEKINLKNFSWNEWLKHPKNYSSMNLLEIDLSRSKLTRAYSISKRMFYNCDQNFLTGLLNLKLVLLNDDERKKIGPAPNDETDRRQNWNPPMIKHGAKQKNPNYLVYRALWPKDGSLLSDKWIDLYFDKDSYFSFPYWIQVSTGNIEIILKIIDSGNGSYCHEKMPK